MKVGGRERVGDGAALEALFDWLPVTADWTMGFFAGLCTGPDAVEVETWIDALVPKDASVDDSAVRAKIDLLARLRIAAEETLGTTPEIICPEPDKPAQEAVEFCQGYLRGAGLHPTWRSDELATQKLAPFEALATDGTTTTHRELLGSHIAELRAYWQSKRTVVHTTPKVGRNDPCPCGSGKKHKKCCLGLAR